MGKIVLKILFLSFLLVPASKANAMPQWLNNTLDVVVAGSFMSMIVGGYLAWHYKTKAKLAENDHNYSSTVYEGQHNLRQRSQRAEQLYPDDPDIVDEVDVILENVEETLNQTLSPAETGRRLETTKRWRNRFAILTAMSGLIFLVSAKYLGYLNPPSISDYFCITGPIA